MSNFVFLLLYQSTFIYFHFSYGRACHWQTRCHTSECGTSLHILALPLLLPASLIRHMLLGWAVHSHQPFLASAATHYTLLTVLQGFMGGRAVTFLLTHSSSKRLSPQLSPALHPYFPLILTLSVMACAVGVFGFAAVVLFAQGRGVHSGQ